MTVLTSGAAGNLREQILSAAASCFRERGIKATKMQEIAKRAGISVGNFYNYFENKDAIMDDRRKATATPPYPPGGGKPASRKEGVPK